MPEHLYVLHKNNSKQQRYYVFYDYSSFDQSEWEEMKQLLYFGGFQFIQLSIKRSIVAGFTIAKRSVNSYTYNSISMRSI